MLIIQCQTCRRVLRPSGRVLDAPTEIHVSPTKTVAARKLCKECWKRQEALLNNGNQKKPAEGKPADARPPNRDELLETLRTGEDDALLDALKALGKLGDATTVPYIRTAMLDEESYRMSYQRLAQTCRASAASALGDIGGQEALDALAAALHDRRFWYDVYFSDMTFWDADTVLRSLLEAGDAATMWRALASALGNKDVKQDAARCILQILWEPDNLYPLVLEEEDMKIIRGPLMEARRDGGEGSYADHALRQMAERFPALAT